MGRVQERGKRPGESLFEAQIAMTGDSDIRKLRMPCPALSGPPL